MGSIGNAVCFMIVIPLFISLFVALDKFLTQIIGHILSSLLSQTFGLHYDFFQTTDYSEDIIDGRINISSIKNDIFDSLTQNTKKIEVLSENIERLSNLCYLIVAMIIAVIVLIITLWVHFRRNQLQNLNNSASQRTPKQIDDTHLICIICQSAEREYMFDPCHHFCVCSPCANTQLRQYARCPLCNGHATGKTKIYS